MNIKQELLTYEAEFEKIKMKTERKHVIILAAFFMPIVIAIFVLGMFESAIPSWLRPTLYGIFLAGLAAHFYIRYMLYKSKKRYGKYFAGIIGYLKKAGKKTGDADKIVIKAVKDVFKEREIDFTYRNIEKQAFWLLLLFNLGISDENDFTRI
jgi:hypothetical protein